ncbi:serine protease grass [Cephus cinctus]|uniref:Serine protease grass n=1 Tax=Cephus cinctus TaxID=211228 RepID=A0AAJ7VZL0_CEPCN|nr:serine protease grass [Cephus cinctus]
MADDVLYKDFKALTYSVFLLCKVTVTGWGATEIDGTRKSSTELLQINIPIVPYDRCAQIFKDKVDITYKQLCAGGERPTDSSSGDSGGPLQTLGLLNYQLKYIQYGVVSFGIMSCGTQGIPGVYTRVSYYMDWILNTIAD